MNEPIPKEPLCPHGRKPHRQRIDEIVKLCPVNKTAGVAIDDTPEHRDYYLYQLAKYKEISVLSHGTVAYGVYIIKITKSAVN